ncbi:MAG: putative bifunctional diguanylate cyclase/phosphodiesterase [Geminicoccaceae bacterium]
MCASRRGQCSPSERRARFLAHHDALTNLANRTRLAQAIEKALVETRQGQANFYLLALDLDGFKGVNDTYGHHTGDALLKIIANRLLKIFRDDDLVARLGGDEFPVIIRQCPSAETVAEIASRTIAAIEQPVIIGNNTIHVSTSIGIAESPKDGMTLQDVLRCADVALYEAKAAGRRAFCFFAAEMDEMLLHRRRLEAGLRQTMEAQNLELHFQPQVDLESGHIFGVEALVRWTDPALGQVAPGTFLDIASQTGLIFDLGSWVMEKACRSAVSWARRGLTPQLAINVSPKQLFHRDFLTILDSILMTTGFPARQLTLEITEDAMVGNDEAALETLMSLRQRGITLAIDDFGTGYSNLGYLKRLPITYLKIDRTFVKDIESDASDRAIISGIINLASSLGLKTIAEGIETEEQCAFLLESNCKMAQGFLFQQSRYPNRSCCRLSGMARPCK